MDIKALVEARLLAYDPLIDLSEGSIPQTTIVDPIVRALEQDPLSSGTREFLTAKFKESFPLMPLAEGDALSDVLISASELFFEAYRRELEGLRRGQSILSIDSMTDDDADALAANWFYSRTLGTNASGTVRIIVDRAQEITVSPVDNIFSTPNNVTFAPTATFVFTASQVLANALGNNRYFVDVPVSAQQPGTAGNIVAGEINTVTNVLNLISSTNDEPFSGGTDRDSSEQLLTVKLPRAISERTTVTSRGIIAKLSTEVSGVRNYQVVGLDDPEMQRDSVSGHALGEQRAAGVAYVRDDIVWLDVAGEVLAGDSIVLRLVDTIDDTVTVEIAEILLSAEQASLRNRGNTYIIRAQSMVYSGETVAPFAASHKKTTARIGHVEIDETTNLGGRADVYLNTSDDVAITSTVNAKTENVLCAGVGISWPANTTRATLSHADGLGNAQILPGSYLYYRLAADEYVFEIFEVVSSDAQQTVVVLKTSASTVAVQETVLWKNLATLDMSLTSPQEIIYPAEGQRVLTVQGNIGSDVLTANLSLAPFGVLPGDLVLIDGTLNSIVVKSVEDMRIGLTVPLSETIGNVPALIVRTQNGIPSPVTTLTEVSLGDRVVPYGRALGMKVHQLAGNRKTIFAGTGFVSPSYAWAVPAKAVISKSATETETQFTKLRSAIDGAVNPSTILNNVFTVDGQIPDYGTCVLGIRGDVRTADKSLENRLQEIPIYNEMLMGNTRNIYVSLGDVYQTDRLTQLPAQCVDGDILQVATGQNAGNYVIRDSIQIYVNFNEISGALPDGKFFRNLVSADLAKARASSETDLNFFVSVTLIRIYGEFPVREHAVIEKYFRTTDIPDKNTLSDFDLLMMLSSPEALVDTAALSADVQQVSTALSMDAAAGCASNDISIDTQPLVDALQKSTRSTYAVGNAAVGRADVLLQEDATCEIYAPRVDVVPLASVFSSLEKVVAGNEPDTYKTYEMTTGTDGSMTICARPGRYFSSISDGEVFTDWATWPRGVPVAKRIPEVDLGDLTFFDGVSKDALTVSTYPVLDLETAAHTILDARISHELHLHEERFVVGASHVKTDSTLFHYFPQIDGVGLTTDELKATPSYQALSDQRNASGDTLASVVSRFENNEQIRWRDTPQDINDFVQNQNGFMYDNAFYTLSPTSLSEDRGASIAIASCSAGSNEISLIKRNEVDVFSMPAVGDLATLKMGSTTTTHIVSGAFSDGRVVLDTPAGFTSASVEKYGECFVNKTENKAYLYGLAGYNLGLDGNITTLSPDSTQATLLGASTSFLSEDDIGKRLTLWGFFESFDIDVSEAIEDEDQDNLSPENTYGTSRCSLGSFQIFNVQTTYRTEPLLGRQVIHTQTVTLSGFEGAEGMDGYASLMAAETVRAFFVVTNGTEEFVTEEGVRLVTEMAEAQFFKPSAEVSRIAAVRNDGTGFLRIVGMSGASAPSENSVFQRTSANFNVDGEAYVGYSTTLDRNNPYIIGRSGVHRTQTSTIPLEVQSIGFLQNYESLSDTSLRVENEYVEGYTVFPEDRQTSRSTRGAMNISVPSEISGQSSLSEALSMRALFSSSILQAQSLVSSRNDRVVCSDLLVRRMAPGYIGAEITYVGGPNTETAAQSLTDLINNSIVTSTPLAKSSIVQRLHRLGAARVHLPLRLYVCVEDMSHRRHVREIKDVLSANMDLQIDATPRIVSLTAAPYDRKLMGAQLSLTRLAATANNLGTGGI